MNMMKRKAKQYGHWAFARHCHAIGVPFDDCYFTIFGRYPHG